MRLASGLANPFVDDDYVRERLKQLNAVEEDIGVVLTWRKFDVGEFSWWELVRAKEVTQP
jgi:hypothetical protein